MDDPTTANHQTAPRPLPASTEQGTSAGNTTEAPHQQTGNPGHLRVLLTVEEAAERLSIGRTNMYALIKSGQVASVRIGHLRRVPADALTAYVRQLTADQIQAA